MYAVRSLFKVSNLVAEEDLRLTLDRIEQHARKIAARQRHEPSAGQLTEYARPEPCYAFATGVHDSQLAHPVTHAAKLVCKPHAFSDVVACAPEVDDVSAGAQAWRIFDNRGLEAGGVQPEGERGASDPGA